ncbi:mandelate racemase/muconate lactonizing enzyme family protein [Roseivivax isoporae]|uniref:Mandelate racemase n=1 Tax=Roseivivax isoporae LMG 25204 TaxID=1449351 RepID=X7F6W6_9RHOB|nr:mandelate racemase/muconate lactonizing enzyme family protein [Roseivivax isoporae]ETX27851.1 mandelate racemase [Roseivivax isoporae LMG 25204]
MPRDLSPKTTAIARVSATPVNVPVRLEIAGAVRETGLSAVIVEVETEDGLVGHGFTAITEEEAVAPIVTELIAPAIVGADALATEAIWDRLYWLLTPRGQSGYASHAIAAVDLALWDIRGRALGLPVWRLLGGARDSVPLYATCGFPFLDRDQLVASARSCVAQGFERVKMTVAAEALARRDAPRDIMALLREDAARVRAVREAVGPDVMLFIDANCNLDPFHAAKLAEMVAEARVDLFEEPIAGNDAAAMADLRRRTGLSLSAGQNEGQAFRFRDLLSAGAVDLVQPNVAITGGITQCLKIAGLAHGFGVPIANGGAWPFHNMHLQAGVTNGTLVEWHLPAVALCRTLFRGLPEPEAGRLRLPDTPGLGFDLDQDAVRDCAARPSARGRGKG